jgi:adenine-specific DNA-methyltransferase
MSYVLGQQVLNNRSSHSRKLHGQFFTPPPLARFIATQLGEISDQSHILDPALGSGTLICAIIDQLIAADQQTEIWIDGYEIDRELCSVARVVLQAAIAEAKKAGITLHVQICEGDFVIDSINVLGSPIFAAALRSPAHDYIIANPPYFKLKQDDMRVKAARGIVSGHTNIYTMFMALSLKLLKPGGRACFIVPRSFCSGSYFSAFRRSFLEYAVPRHVHLFETRNSAFKDDDVLQENVVLSFDRKDGYGGHEFTETITISSSQSITDLDNRKEHSIPENRFLGKHNHSIFFRLPTSKLDEQLLDAVDSWHGSLERCGLAVSTGPVVAFRATEFLREAEDNQSVPLMWLYHVKPHAVQWPAINGNRKNKPQWISVSDESRSLVVPNANYVLLRRFSAKEDERRLVAAPLLFNQLKYDSLGFENHLNYIYGKTDTLTPEMAVGLSALYNSALIDRYFRLVNGNTQVNATELRSLPLPELAVISTIGKQVQEDLSGMNRELVVINTLKENGLLDIDFPIINNTRTTWEK